MFDKILLIGNGPSVLQYRYGEFIDQFQNVCRMNAYQTEGYEESVGQRTTYWMTTRYGIKMKGYEHIQSVNGLILLARHWCEIINELYERGVMQHFNPAHGTYSDSNHSKVWLGPVNNSSFSPQMIVVLPVIETIGGYEVNRPSAGLVYLEFMLRVVKDRAKDGPVPSVIVHGYDHFSGIQHHYFDNDGQCAPHNGPREAEIVQLLERDGKVQQLTDYLKHTAKVIE